MKHKHKYPKAVQKCSTTCAHLEQLEFLGKKLLTVMKGYRRTAQEKDALMVKFLPLYLRVVALQQELLQAKPLKDNTAEPTPPLSAEEWQLLGEAVTAQQRKKAVKAED